MRATTVARLTPAPEPKRAGALDQTRRRDRPRTMPRTQARAPADDHLRRLRRHVPPALPPPTRRPAASTGFVAGDIVAYRCEDCLDRWDIELE